MMDIELAIKAFTFLVKLIYSLIQKWDWQRLKEKSLWIILKLYIDAISSARVLRADWAIQTCLLSWVYLNKWKYDMLAEVLDCLNVVEWGTAYQREAKVPNRLAWIYDFKAIELKQ